jgi:hypothetical protein
MTSMLGQLRAEEEEEVELLGLQHNVSERIGYGQSRGSVIRAERSTGLAYFGLLS